MARRLYSLGPSVLKSVDTWLANYRRRRLQRLSALDSEIQRGTRQPQEQWIVITTPEGNLIRDDAGMRLEFVRTLRTNIDDAWSALTDSERTARWFGSWTCDPTSGRTELVLTDEEDHTAQRVEIVECTPPSRLVLDMPGPDGTWQLAIELTEAGNDTTMVFEHRLAEPYEATDIGPGWHYYLDRLEAIIANVEPPQDFDSYMTSLAKKYATLPE